MKVWVGDPCYVLNDDQYETVLDRSDPEVDLEDFSCVVYNTFCGDGRFYDQNGKEYIVDSGQLCIIPLECVYYKEERPWLIKCGQIHDDKNWSSFFLDDHSEDEGKIQFGEVIIQT